MRILKFNLLLLIFICFALSAYAATLTINGTVYNETGNTRSGVNVTVEIYSDFDTVDGINSTLSNGSGNYQVNVTDVSTYMYKLILKDYNDTNATKSTVDYMGASLPAFPHSEFTNMLNLSAVNFYLKEGATININASNSSDGAKSFTYQIKDKALGYPVISDWQTRVFNLTAHLPANRSYSIMIYPQNSMPISYDLNNISKYSSPKVINISFNTTETYKWVSGCINASDSMNLTKVEIIPYLTEPGDMVFAGQPMPRNMSTWRGGSLSDNFSISNTSLGPCNGFYNMTLVGTASGTDIMLLAVGQDNDSNYYGAFKNISLNAASSDEADFNFTLLRLPGTLKNISLDNMVGGGTATNYNITVPQVNFAIINSSNHSLTSATGHIEVQLDYSSLEGPSFTWMTDLSSSDSGVFTLPLLNSTIKKLNFYTQNYAPVKKSYTAEQVNAGNINITLKQFNPGGIDASDVMDDIFIAIYKSSSECDVPTPPATCVLAADSEEDNFKPLNAVVSGGKTSFRMRKNSNNITVHYKNVDLLASGPPDVVFDSSATQNQSGSALEAAWRFGSQGPEIYDSVLVGIPYTEGDIDEAAPVSILIGNLYDEDWNSIWNSTANPYGENYTNVSNNDFNDFNQSWFNSTTDGLPCDTSDITANCFVNTTTNMIWLQIPHFSGIGPAVKSTTVGGVTMKVNTSRIRCIDICTIDMNVTNSNYTIASSLRNIILNITENVLNVRDFKIYKYNNSDWVVNGSNATLHNNYNLTLSNGSDETIHQYRIEVNKTNRTDTIMNITYNISTLTSELNLEVTLDGTAPTISSPSSSDVGSSSATITCTTNENSTCRYSTAAGDYNYTLMSSAMTANAAGTSHTKGLTSLSASTSYTYNMSCADIAGNEMNTSSSVTFTTSAASSSSSGSGGGGGGGTTDTSVSASKMWSTFIAGTNTMTVSKTVIAFTELAITSSSSKSNVEVTVKKLSSKPTATGTLDDTAYQYLEITKDKLLDSDVTKAEIKFKVEKSWLNTEGINEANIKLYRYSSDKWNALTTTKTSSDSNNVYYKATSPGLSYFVIAGRKPAAGTAEEVAGTVGTETTEEEEAETAEEGEEEITEKPVKKSWLVWLIIAIIVIALLAVFFVYIKKQEEKLE